MIRNLESHATKCQLEFMSKRYHILVADDNELNQQVLLGMLEHAGYSVDLASDGCEAIKRLSEARYDLVILDCMMPIMDGFESARAIRSSDSGSFDPNIPILGITALATSDDHEKCLNYGMNRVITKPVAAKILFSHLEQMLESTRSDQEPAVEFENKPDIPALADKITLKNNPPVDLIQILRSMSATLIRDTELWIIDLARLQEAGDYQQLNRLAHKIRGTADLLNEVRISALARSLEECSKAEDAMVTANYVFGLVAELQRLTAELESSLHSG